MPEIILRFEVTLPDPLMRLAERAVDALEGLKGTATPSADMTELSETIVLMCDRFDGIEGQVSNYAKLNAEFGKTVARCEALAKTIETQTSDIAALREKVSKREIIQKDLHELTDLFAPLRDRIAVLERDLAERTTAVSPLDPIEAVSGQLAILEDRICRIEARKMPENHADATRMVSSLTRRHAGWKTPEREAVLRRDWPAGVPAEDILAEMARLDGAALPENKYRIGDWAMRIGLFRPEGHMSAIGQINGRKGAGRTGRGLWLTTEREALLREAWPRGDWIEDIRAAMAALPGPDMPQTNVIGKRACGIGLKRPKGYLSRIMERRPALRHETTAAVPDAVDEVPDAVDETAVAVDEQPIAAAAAATAVPFNRLKSETQKAFNTIPAELQSRDGALSIARLLEAEADSRPILIDRTALEDWARENGTGRGSGESDLSLLRRVNSRRAAFGLPPWQLGETLGARGHMPRPKTGADYGLRGEHED